MIDAEDLLLCSLLVLSSLCHRQHTLPVWLKSTLKLTRRTKVLAERLLDDDAVDTVLCIAVALQVLRDRDEDRGRQSHVEDAVTLLSAFLNLVDVLVQLLEWLILIVLTSDVGADLAELVKLLLDLFCRSLDELTNASNVLGVVHLSSSIADDLDIFGKEFVAVLSTVS